MADYLKNKIKKEVFCDQNATIFIEIDKEGVRNFKYTYDESTKILTYI